MTALRSVHPAHSPHRDFHAAELIQEFLDDKGWSARRLQLETEIQAEKHGKDDLAVSRRTIDRILADGHVPRARAKASICLVMEVAPWQVWGRRQMPLAWQRAVATSMATSMEGAR